MQISLDEVRRVAKLYQIERAERAYPREAVPAPASELSISEEAQLVHNVLNEVHSSAEVREDRIQELKAKIEAGEYNVSSETIAEAIFKRTLADRLR
jgi:negative regulator of flagellin synthesis FlgM